MPNESTTVPSKIDADVDEANALPTIPVLRELIHEESQRVLATLLQAEAHSGPLPSPTQLSRYDELLPGTAQVIIDEYQANGAHVREMEALALRSQKDDNDRNRRVAERLVWASLLCVTGLAVSGHDTVAMVLAATTVGAIVTGFFAGKPATKNQRPADADDSGV